MSLVGFVVVDKPAGLTSHDIVGILRATTGVKKVGHTGTLDPFATGVLPVALGKATRFIQYLDEGLKVYDATISFTGSTDTGDPEGELVRPGGPPDWERLPAVLEARVGEQQQTPPAYSAVKVDGKPLYKYARAGVAKKAAPRTIQVYGLRELARTEDSLRLEIRCSRGTYARVLAEDIADALGTAGHLSALRRTRSGPFGLPGMTLDEWAADVAGRPDYRAAFRNREARPPWVPRPQAVEALRPRVLSLKQVLSHLPTVKGSERLLQGGGAPPPPPEVEEGGRYAAVLGDRLLAVVERRGMGGRVLLRA